MKNVDDLIESAGELTRHGLSRGEIADELNVSRDTASWLVERSGVAGPEAGDDAEGGGDGNAPEPPLRTEGDAAPGGPSDIHVDWSAFGRDSARLTHLGKAMADLLSKRGEAVDLTIGIEKAGAPLATTVARELDTDLGSYAPRKHQWDEGDIEDYGGSFSRNFAAIRSRDCYVVDDTITSGTTMRETIEAIRGEGGEPVACVVLVDKQGVDELDGVPVYSLINVVSVATDE
jgi:orotate phosphoribosyltransferase